ncbi:hypothetical protein Daus18300_000310 [Diaporthe australafricana]|uniref:Uncharacterized protein n=1 Tax=Diaporthe australafricana TaxID=127596 RepID=A0ABR3Y5W1_9PEZI
MTPHNSENHVPNFNAQEPQQARKATVQDLGDGEHLAVFTRALSNVTSTDIARSTYAQIVDGLPLKKILIQMPNRPERGHSVYGHTELCDGVLDRISHSQESFDLQVLQFKSHLVHRYLAASLGSRDFKGSLIEIIAVSVHQIPTYLHKLGLNLGNHACPHNEDTGIPTFLFHDYYKNIDQYPNGVAGAVGYWAEAEILGGVALFDRRQQQKPLKDSGEVFLPHNRGEDVYRNLKLLDPEDWEIFDVMLSEYRALTQHFLDNPDAIYSHTNREEMTYRIWQLLPEQKKSLLDFLLARPGEMESPLPIHPSEKNLFRVDPEDPITETRIYRDVWERKPLGEKGRDQRLRHCRGDRMNYSTPADEHRSKTRGWLHNELIWQIGILESKAQNAAEARQRLNSPNP